MERSAFVLTPPHGEHWWQDNVFSEDISAADADKKHPLLHANSYSTGGS